MFETQYLNVKNDVTFTILIYLGRCIKLNHVTPTTLTTHILILTVDEPLTVRKTLRTELGNICYHGKAEL